MSSTHLAEVKGSCVIRSLRVSERICFCSCVLKHFIVFMEITRLLMKEFCVSVLPNNCPVPAALYSQGEREEGASLSFEKCLSEQQ